MKRFLIESKGCGIQTAVFQICLHRYTHLAIASMIHCVTIKTINREHFENSTSLLSVEHAHVVKIEPSNLASQQLDQQLPLLPKCQRHSSVSCEPINHLQCCSNSPISGMRTQFIPYRCYPTHNICTQKKQMIGVREREREKGCI